MDYGFLEELRISRLRFGVKYSSELRTSEPRSKSNRSYEKTGALEPKFLLFYVKRKYKRLLGIRTDIWNNQKQK